MRQLSEACNVFSQYVKLNIYNASDLDVAKIGVVVSIWDYCNSEAALSGLAHGERNAIDCNRTFVHGEVSTLRHVAIEIVFESVVC